MSAIWAEIASMISEQNCPTRGSITIIYHSSVPEYFWNKQWYTLSWNKAIHSSQRKANLVIINLRKTLKVEKQSEQSFCANCLPNMWEVNRNSTLNFKGDSWIFGLKSRPHHPHDNVLHLFLSFSNAHHIRVKRTKLWTENWNADN